MENTGERSLPSLAKYEGSGTADSGYGSFVASECSQSGEITEVSQTLPTVEESMKELNISDNKQEQEDTLSHEEKERRQKIINYLISAFTPDEDGDTYLAVLLTQNRIAESEQLIDLCPKSVYFDIQNNAGQAAIHVAAYLNFADIVRKLILKGAKVELVDSHGNNIFHLCADRGHVETLDAIIDAGKNTGQLDHFINVMNERDFSGLTPFYLAVCKKNDKICSRFCCLNVDVNLADMKNGNSPLHEAVMEHPYADPEFVHFLLTKCNVNVNSQNTDGVTCLHIAASKGDKPVCSVLLMNNADPNIQDMNGNIPAVYASDQEIVQHLQCP